MKEQGTRTGNKNREQEQGTRIGNRDKKKHFFI
jgi:hypothetical protein